MKTVRLYKSFLGVGLLMLGIFLPVAAMGLDAKAIMELQAAGVGDQVIEALIAEKSIETAAFDIEEIVALKRAGISNTLLHKIVKAQSFIKNRQPLIYGTAVRPLRLTTANDLISLKEAGFGEPILMAIIDATVTDKRSDKRQRALQMLNDAGFLLDLRKAETP